MTLMLDFWHKSIIGDVDKFVASVRELEAENTRLKQPVGALQPPVPLQSGKITHSMVETDHEWAKALKWLDEDVPLAEQNDEINRSNQSVITTLAGMIVAAGIPSERSVWKRNKSVKEPMEWKSALTIPSNMQGVGTYSLANRRKEWEQRRKSFVEKKAEEDRRRQQAREQEEASRAAQIRLVDACRELGLNPVESAMDDVKAAIRSKCKYLDLAIAGSETRGDWSEGCWRVESALGRFTPETQVDKDIVEEWWDICNDFDDGRSFRDTTWNYDRIIGELANKDVVAMWQKLVGE
jgi:hypothetical protein